MLLQKLTVLILSLVVDTGSSFKISPKLRIRKSKLFDLSIDGDISKDIDPLTAGMSSEEITNYISNVGGGLCGFPDSVKTFIGLGLNLSLLVFGVFIVSYGKFKY